METGRELEQLARIESKLNKLISKYNHAQDTLNQAQQEIKELQTVIQKKDAEIKNFQNTDNIAKIVNTIAAESFL